MTGIGVTLILLMALTVIFGPRRWAALGVMAAVCYITQGQLVEVAGFHFTAIRIVLLVGMVRIIMRGESRDLKLNRIDWVVIAYTSVVTLATTLRTGNSGLVYQLGVSYDILFSYFIFRCLLTNFKDVQDFLHGLAFLIVPLAVSMIVESVTGRNAFVGLGGITEGYYIREGRLRCQGSFRGPITAGIFGATLIPLFVGLFPLADRRRAAIAGVLAATAITWTSNSSGPLMAFLSGLTGLMFWQIRHRMRMVRWGIVAALVSLHIFMKAPVWYLIAKISALTGGDGWHRSFLMDQAIKHFSDWWLLGTSKTGDWMPYKLTLDQADITNQYIASGINGGLAGLILFVLIIVGCFRNLGMALKESRCRAPNSELLFWGLGSALFAHAFAFFSVTYFDQMYVPWWALLGVISSTTSDILRIDLAEQ